MPLPLAMAVLITQVCIFFDTIQYNSLYKLTPCSQARPVSARPTMAALLEKMPPDYALATCPEKPSDDTIKVRPVVPQKPEDITSRMPADWRQQLLRHIEAKRLDRVRKCK